MGNWLLPPAQLYIVLGIVATATAIVANRAQQTPVSKALGWVIGGLFAATLLTIVPIGFGIGTEMLVVAETTTNVVNAALQAIADVAGDESDAAKKVVNNAHDNITRARRQCRSVFTVYVTHMLSLIVLQTLIGGWYFAMTRRKSLRFPRRPRRRRTKRVQSGTDQVSD